MKFMIGDGDWVPEITLPGNVPDNSIIMVSSTATWGTHISPSNQAFANTRNLGARDSYTFIYNASMGSWLPFATPVQSYDAGPLGGQINTPTAPKTVVNFSDGNWTPTITLPASAADRDEITIRSSATYPTTINNTNITNTSTLRLKAGSEYSFWYIKEQGKWVVRTSPTVMLTPSDLTASLLPDMDTPKTRLTASDGNWSPVVTLPANAQSGDEVVIVNNASYEFAVTGAATSFTKATLPHGETVRFRYDGTKWTRATGTITMLLAYGDDTVTKIGASAEQARLANGLQQTNDALERSGANFYVRSVGFLQHHVPGTTVAATYSAGETDSVLVARRTELAADATYYEGDIADPAYCGLGGVLQPRGRLFAVGTIQCGANVMRHEFGHNMGLTHPSEHAPLSPPYATGYAFHGIVDDIMGGNGESDGYYSNPNLYTQDYGIPRGLQDQADAVRFINEHSPDIVTTPKQ